MKNQQDVTLALARARRAIGVAKGSAHSASNAQILEAVERLCDALDGVVAALCAEPALRIDYSMVAAPAPLASVASVPKAPPKDLP